MPDVLLMVMTHMEKLSVSISPHVVDHDSTARIMWSVVLALVPAFVGGLYVFGSYAAAVTLVSVVSCVVTEAVIRSARGVPVRVTDGSAVVTGVLLAFVLPADVPLWIPAVGGVISIGIAKELFGGLGSNIWNPALVGRAVLQLSFPEYINPAKWAILRGSQSVFQWSRFVMNILNQNEEVAAEGFDAVTMATPLSMNPADGIRDFAYDPGSIQMWLGLRPGCIGETSFILLAVGALSLILLRRIKWHVPVLYIATVALLTWMLPYSKASFQTEGFFQGYPAYHVVFGGLALGAFFMATDMVTSPLTSLGQAIFALGCGVLTAVIRLYGGYPEGVCYSILIMNTAVPLIDRFTRRRVFGTRKAKAA